MRRRAEISAGLLAFRRRNQLEVLLAHPGGPFWAKKDDGAWTIPKGVAEPGADLLATARREFKEETNLTAAENLMPLTPVKQKSGKAVHAWAFEADLDLAAFASNTFETRVAAEIGPQTELSRDRSHRLLHAADRDDQNYCLSAAAAARARTAHRLKRVTTPA